MTVNAGVVEKALTLFSAWLRLFRFVAKTAAVECGKCTSIHTPRCPPFLSTPSGSFQYTSFRPDRNWNGLRTQTTYSEYGKYG